MSFCLPDSLFLCLSLSIYLLEEKERARAREKERERPEPLPAGLTNASPTLPQVDVPCYAARAMPLGWIPLCTVKYLIVSQ
jgi:hypothetical protein